MLPLFKQINDLVLWAFLRQNKLQARNTVYIRDKLTLLTEERDRIGGGRLESTARD
jgi:hypothetical protein